MLIFLSIMIIQISGVILPGPDFFVTINNSIKFGHKYGIYTALGIAFGILLNSLIVYWFGTFLLYNEPLLFNIIVFIGLAYLAYIAFNLYKNVFFNKKDEQQNNLNTKNQQNSKNIPDYKFFLNGAFTNLANVKVFIFFCSLLSLVDKLQTFGKIAVWFSICLITGLWFCIVALFFGNNKLRQGFLNNINKIEFVSAIFITVFIVVIFVEQYLK